MAGLRIELLGGLVIAGGEISASASLTRKARALVAYLALQGARGQSREKLSELLWADSAEEQARTNLRQALSSIRKALNIDGTTYLVTDGDQISLAGEDIDLDVALFEQLVSEATPGALKRAAALYKGDLLDGFSLKEDSFEAWVRAERERLRHRASDALTKLMAHCDDVGNTERCIETAAWLLTLDPLREAAHRTLMRAYAAQGRQASALKQFETCRDILKRELGVEPEPETVALYRNIRQQRATAPARRGTRDTVTGVELSLPDKPSIAVLPFDNMSGDPEQEYFSDGITEDIITELSRFNEFAVIARNSSFHYKGQSPKIEDVERELGVKYVVEGSVRRAADRVRVTAQLIDTETKSHIWADRYDRQLDDIFAIQDEVTEAVVARVADRVKDAVTTLSRSRPKQSMTAYDLVLQSRPYRISMTRSDSEKAAKLLTQAIALDPDYALAHASLAFVRAGEYEEGWAAVPDAVLHDAMALARQAVALDDSDGYAHASLAYVHNISGNFDRAVHEARTALSLNPNHVNIIMTSGWISVVAGDPEAGIERIQHARRLNPYMGGFDLWTLGLAFFGAKRYEEAIDVFSQVDLPTSLYLVLAAAFVYLGRDSDARDAMNVFLGRAKGELNPFPGDDPQAWRRYLERWIVRKREEDFEHILEGARRAGLPV